MLVTGVTCPVCGTFCDDIELVVQDNVITDEDSRRRYLSDVVRLE